MGTVYTRRNHGTILIVILNSDSNLTTGFQLWVGFVLPSLVRRASSLVERTWLRDISSKVSVTAEPNMWPGSQAPFALKHLTGWPWTLWAISGLYCTMLARTLQLLASIPTYSSKDSWNPKNYWYLLQTFSDSNSVVDNLLFLSSSSSISQSPQISSLKAWKSLSKENRWAREQK